MIRRENVQTDELTQYYSTCAVFVFPSLIETFGNPLLEAMIFASPIACSREAAMPEILMDSGLYFDPRNAEDIAATIDKLLSDQKLSETLGIRAAQRARSFLWSETARRTCNVFKEVAA